MILNALELYHRQLLKVKFLRLFMMMIVTFKCLSYCEGPDDDCHKHELTDILLFGT